MTEWPYRSGLRLAKLESESDSLRRQVDIIEGLQFPGSSERVADIKEAHSKMQITVAIFIVGEKAQVIDLLTQSAQTLINLPTK